MTNSSPSVIVAVDQGTSSTKVIAVDTAGRIVGQSSTAIGQRQPRLGWVEQDAREILDSVVRGIEAAVKGLEHRVTALAISSQRESALAWDRSTGMPLGPMLGWQDRRTVAAAQVLEAEGHGPHVRAVTGLPIDPMFSALKFTWLLDEIDLRRTRSAAGEIALGTVDSWLTYSLTGEHRIEAGNASRTQLLNLQSLDWDDSMLELFRIPRAALPRVAASTEATEVVTGIPCLPEGTRITGILGDSHAALFGHGARTPGAVKVTLGTGSSIMGLLAPDAPARTGLVKTIAWCAPEASYAFEGNILSTGATAVWLAGILGITTAELFELASTAGDDSAVDLVPAFAGLGAPWWDESARAIITGFDLGTTRTQLARAAVESIALQIEDVLSAAEQGRGSRCDTILIDGGPAANDALAQLLADLCQRRVQRPNITGLSALGAAYLAGIVAGIWTQDDVLALGHDSTSFEPLMTADAAATRRKRWHKAVARARSRTHTPINTTLEEEGTQ